jgi:hypothetical protein
MVLHDLGVEWSILDSEQDTFRKGDGPLCQPIHHSSLDFGAHIKRRAKLCQVWEYEGRSMKEGVKYNHQSTFALPTLLDCAHGLTLLMQIQAW